MKIAAFTILAFVLAVSSAAPFDDPQNAQILRNERVDNGGGSYSFDFETENDIKVSEGGQPEGETQAVHKSGQFEFPLPNGEIFSLKYVANENGYQPESSYLPVAPAFPHPIPEFVLDQIAFAEQQRKEEAKNN